MKRELYLVNGVRESPACLCMRQRLHLFVTVTTGSWQYGREFVEKLKTALQ